MKKIGICVKRKFDAVVCFFTQTFQLFKRIFLKRDMSDVEYRDLAPVDDVPDCEEHLKALAWAVSNTRIKNIALAGPYGSGKSSIINSFLKQNPMLADKSIRISLAAFADIKNETEIHQEVQEGIQICFF